MAVMICQKSLGYSNSPMIHVPRVRLGTSNPGWCHDSTKLLASPRVSSYLVKAHQIYSGCCWFLLLRIGSCCCWNHVLHRCILLPLGQSSKTVKAQKKLEVNKSKSSLGEDCWEFYDSEGTSSHWCTSGSRWRWFPLKLCFVPSDVPFGCFGWIINPEY